jgi:hypothetical protein
MIYISITTVPDRMKNWDSFSKNIESLCNQETTRDYIVLLNIPYVYRPTGEEYVIPEGLSDYNVVINRMDDKGPICKVLGALDTSKDPNDIIIVCDDDHYYHSAMLEYHVKKMEQHKNKAIAFRGDVPVEKREWEEDGVTKYTLKKTHFYFPVKHDSQLLIPGHWHSVSYYRKFFGSDFNADMAIIKDCTNDDTIVGYYLLKNQIDIVCATWDQEVDWRPVNDHGRGAASFPILYPLPYENSGFHVLRQEAGDGYGRAANYIQDLIHENDRVYEQ